MRALVAIANHGTKNRQHLDRLLEEYRTMSYKCDIVVLSDIPKDDLGADVEVRVGRPLSHPWSLGYAHRPVFDERRDDYDLYIYTEDDTLLTERNIDAFLAATEVLELDELPGFIRSEQGLDGSRRYLDVHGPYRWLPESVRHRTGDVYASFSGHHGACYVLTRDQLHGAIASGGYLVEPHADRYDLLIAAATDPYTQCGFTKVVNLSRLDDFVLPHLTNRYAAEIDTPPQWIPAADMDVMLDALRAFPDGAWTGPLVLPETRLPRLRWSKDLYAREDPALIAAVPGSATRVLVVGCGWGLPEEGLLARGHEVAALPIDPIVGARAERRGLEIVAADLDAAVGRLAERRFDCVVFPDVLHLVPDPTEVVRRFVPLLAPGGSVVVLAPNLSDLNSRRRWLVGRFQSKDQPVVVAADFGYRVLDRYDRVGTHRTNTNMVRKWLSKAGLRIASVQYGIPQRRTRYRRWVPKFAEELLADRIVVRATQ